MQQDVPFKKWYLDFGDAPKLNWSLKPQSKDYFIPTINSCKVLCKTTGDVKVNKIRTYPQITQ